MLLLLFALVGCRPAGLESHLPDSFRISLRAAGQHVSGRNRAFLNTLCYAVGKEGDRAEDLSGAKLARDLHQSGQALRDQIDTLDRLLGVEPSAEDLPANARLRVKGLSRNLMGFSTQLSRFTRNKWQFTIGLPRVDTLHHPVEAFLAEGSVGAARVALTQLHAEVTLAEKEALDLLASKVAATCCFCSPRIAPIALAASSTVKAGEAYEAALFLGTGQRSDWHVWKAAFNGQLLPVHREEAHITLPPGQFLPGPAAQWQMDLHLVSLDGRDSILVIRRPYPHILPAADPSSLRP